MNLNRHIANHLRLVYDGENYTAASLKKILSGVDWQHATRKVGDFHTIATLVFHMNYYVSAVLKVLNGGPLDAHDKFSFDCPPIRSQSDWEQLLSKVFTETEQLAGLIENLPETEIWENMADEKYGSRFRNFQGLIEHSYYHLGQIAMLKKLVAS